MIFDFLCRSEKPPLPSVLLEYSVAIRSLLFFNFYGCFESLAAVTTWHSWSPWRHLSFCVLVVLTHHLTPHSRWQRRQNSSKGKWSTKKCGSHLPSLDMISKDSNPPPVLWEPPRNHFHCHFHQGHLRHRDLPCSSYGKAVTSLRRLTTLKATWHVAGKVLTFFSARFLYLFIFRDMIKGSRSTV